MNRLHSHRSVLRYSASVLGLVAVVSHAAFAQIGQLDRIDRDAGNQPITVDLPQEFLQEIALLYQEGLSQTPRAAQGPSVLVTENAATITVVFVSEVALLRNLFGYFTYVVDADQHITITDRQVILPNVAMRDPNQSWGLDGGYGELQTGHQATLRDANGDVRHFAAGTRIGFFMLTDGWRTDPTTGGPDLGPSAPFAWPVSPMGPLPSSDPSLNIDETNGIYAFTTLDALNPEHAASGVEWSRHYRAFRHAPLPGLLSQQPLFIVGVEDVERVRGTNTPRFETRFYSDNDFNDMIFLVSGPVEMVTELANDPDCPNDAYPNDLSRCFATSTQGTLAFEDSYPLFGDADYNDAVMSYDAKEVRNSAGDVTDIILTYNLYARGAHYDHDFGVAIDNLPPDTTGQLQVEYFPSFAGSEPSARPLAYGTSAQIQDYLVPTPDPTDSADAVSLRLRHLIPSTLYAYLPYVCGWNDSGFNTLPTGDRCRSAAVRVTLHFDRSVPDAQVAQAPYDPFLEVRNPADNTMRDIHLPGCFSFNAMPAAVQSPGNARSEDQDPANPYRFTYAMPLPNATTSHYPWVLHIPGQLLWQYPQEGHSMGSAYVSAKADGTISANINAYPEFDAWVASGGMTNTTWYDNPNLIQVIADPEVQYFSDFPWGTGGAVGGDTGGGGGGSGDPIPGPSPPPIASLTEPAVARGAMYFNTTERFNRYYTDRQWVPARTVYVSAGGNGDGSSREQPTSAETALAQVTPGTMVVFLPGTYDACWELSDREGTYEAPIVLYAERNADGTRGVHMNCCGSGRQTCINLEGASYVAIDGFEMQGGRYGARAVGLDYNASAHTRGTAVLNCHIYDQRQDPILTGAADWAVFQNNLTHDAGIGDGHGIYLSNGSDWNIVRFNETYRNARSDFQVNADPLSTCYDTSTSDCDAVAGSGEGGAGASDFFLIEGNYFHHGNGPGPNFTSMRYSVLRNNVFGIYARHGTSFWQETDNPNLGSHDNQVLHNLFIGTNSNHTLQFINSSNRNAVVNNLILGVTIVDATVTANPAVLGLEVDASVPDNTYEGNFYLSARIDGRSASETETVRSDFDPAWLVRFPADITTPADFHPTASAPWLDKGRFAPAAPLDAANVMRPELVDIGPYELP